ncbi:helix-turn-helix domain-containing protein [Streptomyces sp. ME02-8801-2C]|uniref:helix-turn-helix domain-containing protein n=1 Tax=Streptomyces sp. ME02-8801-2C TaxID=3028680 RepID=UPI0029AB72C8|nr:helix-turn-helix domain-containing protein [Streptomyces sp. ME02-8801-2C]MDX3456561.1 helix-turn-helix domain-containing protein [Streptomyces sp. ME02-8801-2C]
MDTKNLSVPSRAQARMPGKNHPHRRPNSGISGVVHENTRHDTRFTVIGNHLAQHRELSLLAIGLSVHIQSLPTGAPVDIKTLAKRFPEGADRISAALRELEAHGYLRRSRERTPGGRIVSRTVSCNQPGRHAEGHPDRRPQQQERQPQPRLAPQHKPQPQPGHSTHITHPAPCPDQAPAPGPAPDPEPTHPAHPTTPGPPKERTPRKPLPAVPQPSYKGPELLQAATDLLAGLRRADPDLLLSACDTAHLAPGVAAWLERDASLTAVRHALISDLPPEGMRRPAALLAHRLITQLPPPAPYRPPTPQSEPTHIRHPLQNCDGCDRAFRSPERGRCRACRGTVPVAA